MSKVTYLKISEAGKLKITKEPAAADYVRVPADEFVPLSDWNELIDEYNLLQGQLERLKNEDSQKEGYITIPTAEFHGLQSALRIIRDRSLQQIDKTTADKHGFSLKYADWRPYDRTYPDNKAYLITKTTPYSLKIDLETVSFLVMKDLKAFYNFKDLPFFQLSPTDQAVQLSHKELLQAVAEKNDPSHAYDWYVVNAEKGRQIKAFLDGDDRPITFEVVRVGSNHGQGVYEVTYWATGLI